MNKIDCLNLYLLGSTTFYVSLTIMSVNFGLVFKAYFEDEDLRPSVRRIYIGMLVATISSLTFI